MPPINSCDNIRLLWKVEPWRTASQRLLVSTDSGDLSPDDEMAVLYLLLDGTTPAALTCIRAPDDRENLLAECSRENTFAVWLNRHTVDRNIWHLAMAWQFYRDWVCGFCGDHWRGRLGRRFPPDRFLDELLAPTHGWLLWSFQIEQLVHAAVADVDSAQHLSKVWRMRPAERQAAFAGIHLPNGMPLLDALHERSPRLRDGTRMSGGRPEMPIVATLHACLSQNARPRGR